jgi:ubiquinone/menaquinone biosynthesis C-methylase UbiE
MNNFDSVAPFYDTLCAMVFGRSMQRAQTLHLSAIASGAKVLVLGGGTGWLLDELIARNPTCQLWYIEASDKMLQRTRDRIKEPANTIIYILGTEESVPENVTFDAVITHFYLDLFPPDTCRKVIRNIRSSVHPDSLWLVSDFTNTRWWQGLMLFAMYKFFDVMGCGIEARSMPDWKSLLEENGFYEVRYQSFYRKFIRSSLFGLRR